MKQFALLSVLVLTLFAGSCVKNSNPPLGYLIDTVSNAYVNHNDSLLLPLEVRFLSGNSNEKVTLSISGLPPHVRLKQDTITGTPTFTANFMIYADSNAVLDQYPVTLHAYSASTGNRSYNFNLGVVHYNCGHYVQGNYSGRNTCRTTGVSYGAIAVSSGDTAVWVSNLGGYGTHTNTFMRLDCNTDSVYVDRQDIGNGVTMWGKGHFTAHSIVMSYTALNTPAGSNDTCTLVLSR